MKLSLKKLNIYLAELCSTRTQKLATQLIQKWKKQKRSWHRSWRIMLDHTLSYWKKPQDWNWLILLNKYWSSRRRRMIKDRVRSYLIDSSLMTISRNQWSRKVELGWTIYMTEVALPISSFWPNKARVWSKTILWPCYREWTQSRNKFPSWIIPRLWSGLFPCRQLPPRTRIQK